ncbi:MAG: beta-Ala-His dipeptidase [Treponema sp.]|nr:beta-Ala-His dipeptidase [Treponema sp.]
MEERVIDIFKQIAAIPRVSGSEKAMCDYLADFAKQRGLSCTRDDFLNVIIERPASEKKKNSAGVFLQAHTDIVCEKAAGSTHDFAKDPITVIRDGDLLKAKDTTLGADNGIGVAMMLAALEENFDNPRIVALFTADEERGMGGVKNFELDDYKDVPALINLDAEDEGIFLSSCAGGVRCAFEIDVERKEYGGASDGTGGSLTQLAVTVKGLNGGHSGLMIDRENANAILVLTRVLRRILRHVWFKLLDISGGGKENSIPSLASAVIAVQPDEVAMVCQIADAVCAEVRGEYEETEKSITVECAEHSEVFATHIDGGALGKLLNLILLLPNGLLKRNLKNNTAVASSNLGVLKVEGDKIITAGMARSNIDSCKEQIVAQFTALARMTGCRFTASNDYPAWEHKSTSRIRDHFVNVYRQQYNKEPNVESVHAGLECAYFAKKLPALDIISVGCDIHGAHSIRENVSVSSALRTYQLVKAALETL